MISADRKEFSCHSSTSKEVVIAFLNENKGNLVNIYYELNGYPVWGYDDDINVLLDDEGIVAAIECVKRHYIHEIKVII